MRHQTQKQDCQQCELSMGQSNDYWLPAEWEAHAVCWMAWPTRTEIWALGFDSALRAFAELVNTIAQFERVMLIVNPGQLHQAKRYCTHLNIEFVQEVIDDAWVRDTMPLFVVNDRGHQRAINWQFNAWGEKFLPYENDRKLGANLGRQFTWDSQHIDMILEGGSIHVDGRGTLMTTEACLLHPNRNAVLSQQEIEQHLSLWLGVERFIWLPEGLYGDVDTDGHIDNVACFVDPHTIVTLRETNKDNPNYYAYEANRRALEQAKSCAGIAYHVVEIDQPNPVIAKGQALPLSYINYYVANGGVIIPAFNDPLHDGAAKECIADLYPGREVVQVDALPLVAGGGGIHCLTMQQGVSRVMPQDATITLLDKQPRVDADKGGEPEHLKRVGTR